MARFRGTASIVRRARSYALYNYLPKAVDWAVKLATRRHGSALSRRGPPAFS